VTDEIERLQGTWQVVDLEADGQRVPESMLAEATVVVRGDRFSSRGMGATYEGTMLLDPTATPRRLDIRFEEGPEAGSTNLAIYELDGDTWRLCLGGDGRRPTGFGTEPGSARALETLRRVGDAGSAGPPPAPAAEAAPGRSSTAPPTELDGEWTMVSGTLDGRPVDRRMLATGRRVTLGDESTVLFGASVFMRMTFRLDPTASPKAIDYVITAGSSKGKAQRGIYDLVGDVLRLCVAPPGAERPAEFTSARGDGRLLTEWRKASG
jgi:uncharacterized protein (TIGR03067 family)